MDTAGVSIPYAVLMGRASRLDHSPSDYKQDRHLSHMGRVAKVATHSAPPCASSQSKTLFCSIRFSERGPGVCR